MRRLIVYLNPIFALLTLITLALTPDINASSLVEVALRDPGDLERLLRGGFDVTYVSRGHMADVIIGDDNELERLGGTGLQYLISQRNIEQFFIDRNRPNRDPMGGYRTLAEITAELEDMNSDFPEIFSEPISVGETIEGRDILAVKISDNSEEDEDEPEVLFFSLLHPREAITQALLLEVMHMLVDGYGNDERLTRLVDEREIWFIPCFNPDGYAYNEEINPNGGGMWRKNKRENDDGSIGVDLNRNWGFEWGRDNIGSDPDPGSSTYRGTDPFSEPETQAVREFINERNFTITISFHAYGNLCIIPPAYDFVHVPQRGVCMALGEKLTRVNNYLPGTGWEIIYLTNGDSDDWIHGSDEHEQIIPFTFEIGTRQDNFWPPLDRRQPLINENIESVLTAIEYCDNPRRALLPIPPDNIGVDQEDDDEVTVFWDIPEDEDNPYESFDVMVRTPGEPYYDVVSDNDENWELFEASRSRFDPHSAPNCFRMEIRSDFSLITTTSEFIAPERLEAWMKLDLSLSNNLAVEVSENGYDWFALPGRDTQDIIVDEYNHGPGLKRIDTDNEWEEFWWDFGDWEGRQVKLRFRHYHFRSAGRNDKVYIDDIGPLPGVEWEEILAENIEEDSWMGELERVDRFMDFCVRAQDAEGDYSFWSLPERVEFDVPLFIIDINQGWSIISAPILIPDPDIAAVFSELVEGDILAIIKNGNGQFYAPRFGFSQLGDWDPTLGYWIKLDEEFNLELEGERIAVDTPIQLHQNWNMVGYLPEQDMSAESAFESLGENLIFAKDDNGRFWSPEFGFNNLPNLEPGEGYLIKLFEAGELIYPGENVAMLPNHNNSELRGIGFQPPSSDNHSLLLTSLDLPTGEIIARNKHSHVIGLTAIRENQSEIGIAVWGEEELSQIGNTYIEEFDLYWRNEVTSTEFPLKLSLINGDKYWQINGFSVFEASLITDVQNPAVFRLNSTFPNPFNSTVTFSYQTFEYSDVKIQIFDFSGRLVDHVINEVQSVGSYHTEWSGNSFPSGVYIARVDTKGYITNQKTNQQIKLLLIR